MQRLQGQRLELVLLALLKLLIGWRVASAGSSQSDQISSCMAECSSFVNETLSRLYATVESSQTDAINRYSPSIYPDAQMGTMRYRENRYCSVRNAQRVNKLANEALRNPDLGSIFLAQKERNYPHDFNNHHRNGRLPHQYLPKSYSGRVTAADEEEGSPNVQQMLAEAKSRFAMDAYMSFFERDFCQLRQLLNGFFTHVQSRRSSNIPFLHLAWVSRRRPDEFDAEFRVILEELCCRYGSLVKEKLRLYIFPWVDKLLLPPVAQGKADRELVLKEGWVAQQIGKLMAATIVTTSQYLLLDVKNAVFQPLAPEYFARFETLESEENDEQQSKAHLIERVGYKLKLLLPMRFTYADDLTYEQFTQLVDNKPLVKTVDGFMKYLGTNESTTMTSTDRLPLPMRDTYFVNDVAPGQLWKTEVILAMIHQVATSSYQDPTIDPALGGIGKIARIVYDGAWEFKLAGVYHGANNMTGCVYDLSDCTPGEKCQGWGGPPILFSKGVCLLWGSVTYEAFMKQLAESNDYVKDEYGPCLFFGVHRNRLMSSSERAAIHELLLSHGVADATGDNLPFPTTCAYRNEYGNFTMCC